MAFSSVLTGRGSPSQKPGGNHRLSVLELITGIGGYGKRDINRFGTDYFTVMENHLMNSLLLRELLNRSWNLLNLSEECGIKGN